MQHMAGKISYQGRLERKFLGNNTVQVSMVLDESFIMFFIFYFFTNQFDGSVTIS